MTHLASDFEEILVLEDNARALERRRGSSLSAQGTNPPVKMQLHRIDGTTTRTIAFKTYRSDASGRNPQRRVKALARLLEHARTDSTLSVVVAGTAYGESATSLAMLCALDRPVLVEVRPGRTVVATRQDRAPVPARDMLRDAHWENVEATMPDGKMTRYAAAKLGTVDLPNGTGELFAAQTGGIDAVHPGTIIGISSIDLPIGNLVQLIAHVRWIGPALRSRSRKRRTGAASIRPSGAASTITARANITQARRRDLRTWASGSKTAADSRPDTKGSLLKASTTLNVVELFAGAGGMGLGFLLAGGARGAFRVIHSAEVHPIYVQTLRSNHRTYDRVIARPRGSRTPEDVAPVDLQEPKSLKHATGVAKNAGGVDIVIGGPPCQGFSAANRNSWHRRNPHNELVDVFARYVEKLRPLAFLMENVQGVLWTRDAIHDLSVVDVIEELLSNLVYGGLVMRRPCCPR